MAPEPSLHLGHRDSLDRTTYSHPKLKAISYPYEPATETCDALPVLLLENTRYLST
jgi:hypothetical protein